MSTELTDIDYSTRFYILEDRVVRPVNFTDWAMFFGDTDKRTVACTTVGGTTVSTVFLGIDNALFETIIFEGPYDQQGHRDVTWANAQRTHDLAVERLRAEQLLLPAPE